MLCGVLVLGGVAATYVAAAQAHPQMDPGVPHFQTFFAAVSAWLYFLNLFDVCTRFHSSPRGFRRDRRDGSFSLPMIAREVRIPSAELQIPLYHIRNESASSGPMGRRLQWLRKKSSSTAILGCVPNVRAAKAAQARMPVLPNPDPNGLFPQPVQPVGFRACKAQRPPVETCATHSRSRFGPLTKGFPRS